MPIQSTPMVIAAAGSIVGSAWVSGNIGAISFLTIPMILQGGAPTDGIAKAWRLQFVRTAYIPITTVIAALNYLYLSHQHRLAGLEWRGYAAGGVANLLLLPFTQLFIMGINRKLMASSASVPGGKVLSSDEARRLVYQWGSLNKYRIFIPLAGAVLGLWNLLSN
ncbi:hypothetical protein GGR50DRAFT_566994 [Xylaria sp. CBS 124048]|nr:hypothetical protein GGR50DRAFT_566994 [Xylaria sp. CBS 124048]